MIFAIVRVYILDMAEEEQAKETSKEDMTVYYVLGAVVLVAVVTAGYFLRPKATTTTPTTEPITQVAPSPSPTPGPITKLACDQQYYNPVVGFPKYYLSVEGGDLPPATKVNCAFTVAVNNKLVTTEKVTSPLTDAPQRSGATFRCTTRAIELTPQVPTKVDVSLVDDRDASATCSALFLLPKP